MRVNWKGKFNYAQKKEILQFKAIIYERRQKSFQKSLREKKEWFKYSCLLEILLTYDWLNYLVREKERLKERIDIYS